MNTDFYEFKKAIDELYKIMIQPIHEYYKAAAVQNCRLELGIDKGSSFSEKYTSVIKDSKEMGAVYTPAEISGYIIRNTISRGDIMQNPFLRIVDPACGTGNIILPCFLILEQIYSESLDEINEAHSLKLSKENLARHILDNNLFGYDLDRLALRVLAADLFCKAGYYNAENFRAEDFLTSDIGVRYDVFIGNPPYIGHKTVDKGYSRELKERFKGIYADKGDISYCFFQRSIDLIQGNGKLSFITSRYFIESPSGTALRRLLSKDVALSRIVDFYGIRPFKGVGIDPVIILMDFGRTGADGVEVIKPRSTGGKNDKKGFIQSLLFGRGSAYMQFIMKPGNLLDSGWILKSAEDIGILEKISGMCRLRLSDIAVSYQGIITGCDKAFVLDRESAAEAGIEEELLKPWIKSSGIEKNRVNPAAVLLIYSDLIEGEASYPNAMRFIDQYREKLMNRRECRTGARKWHMLQWGRKSGIFEGRKIVFPYKASCNRFAIDQGSYFSADVYALVLKEGAVISLEKLLRILNSSTYEYYFKSFAKKLGEDQYEYYPNNIMKLLLPEDLQQDFGSDEEIYRHFGFTDREIDIIEESLSL